MFKQSFVDAINDTNLVELTFNSKNQGVLERKCIPLDYGPMAKSSSGEMKYHFHNTDSDHPMPISEEQIIKMQILEEKFDPETIVHWVPSWNIERDWGTVS